MSSSAELDSGAGVHLLSLALGADLAAETGALSSRVAPVFAAAAEALGIALPALDRRPDLTLRADAYRIRVRGLDVAGGELRLGSWFATPARGADWVGVAADDPVTGQPGLWLAEPEQARAEAWGLTLEEPVAVLVRHLDAVVRAHAAELLDRDAVSGMLDRLQAHAPVLVSQVVRNRYSEREVLQVLRRLLAERVSVRDLPAILEAMDEVPQGASRTAIAEHVRKRLKRAICTGLADAGGVLHVLLVSAADVQALRAGSASGGAGGAVGAIVRRLERARGDGHTPVVVCPGRVRPHLAGLLAARGERVAVLSEGELDPLFRVASVEPIVQAMPPATPVGDAGVWDVVRAGVKAFAARLRAGAVGVGPGPVSRVPRPPETPVAEPAPPVAGPETPVAEPAPPVAEPETPVAEPETSVAGPMTPLAEPTHPVTGAPPTVAPPRVPANELEAAEGALAAVAALGAEALARALHTDDPAVAALLIGALDPLLGAAVLARMPANTVSAIREAFFTQPPLTRVEAVRTIVRQRGGQGLDAGYLLGAPPSPFAFLAVLGPDRVATVLMQEPVDAAAGVLACLEAAFADAVLSVMPEDVQARLFERLEVPEAEQQHGLAERLRGLLEAV